MKKGFTLIELLVVVLILGILSAVALPQYQVAVAKSRYVQLMALAEAFYKAEKIYQLENGKYTFDFNELAIAPPSGWRISATGKHISSDKGVYCYLSDGSCEGDCLTVYCSSDFGSYFPVADDKKLCGARNDLGHKVCKSLGGSYYSTIESGITYYKLP